ncbi:hypothetical protein IT417_00990 [bacterium]|nr:hypothetical protein [bacterium]
MYTYRHYTDTQQQVDLNQRRWAYIWGRYSEAEKKVMNLNTHGFLQRVVNNLSNGQVLKEVSRKAHASAMSSAYEQILLNSLEIVNGLMTSGPAFKPGVYQEVVEKYHGLEIYIPNPEDVLEPSRDFLIFSTQDFVVIFENIDYLRSVGLTIIEKGPDFDLNQVLRNKTERVEEEKDFFEPMNTGEPKRYCIPVVLSNKLRLDETAGIKAHVSHVSTI